MIREALIGAALIGGGGYYALTYSASAAVARTVSATPLETWRPFDLILNQSSQQFASFSRDATFPDGTPATPPIVVSVPGKEIDFRLQKGGAEALHVHLRFEPLADGRQTRMTMKVDVAPQLASGGGPGGKAELQRGLEKIVDELIPQIESGELVKAVEALSEMQRQAAMNPRVRERQMRDQDYKRGEAQAAAARPMLDPNKAAVDPKGASAAPMRDATTY